MGNQLQWKWKIITDASCDFCKELDTIEHYIVLCACVCTFWHSIITWWEGIFHIKIPFTKHELLFGIPNENEEIVINHYNFIILNAKYYIYFNKRQQKQLDLYEFLLLLKHELTMKKTAYKMRNKEHIFEKIWGDLFNNL